LNGIYGPGNYDAIYGRVLHRALFLIAVVPEIDRLRLPQLKKRANELYSVLRAT
jgi:hypothetical protein